MLTELIVFGLAVAVIAVVGIGLGIILARRLDPRLNRHEEGSDGRDDPPAG